MHKVMYQCHLKLTCSFRLGQARYKPYSRSPPSRRARGSAERGNRQGLFLNWAGGFFGFLQSIRPTEEFEGQNKSIKSRVRSTLLIWDTFAFDRVVDVSARVLLRLSPHASLYPSHLPYLFLRQMRYLPWKHNMLKMSTREQCQERCSESCKLHVSRLCQRTLAKLYVVPMSYCCVWEVGD
ncbi:hypothetical protein ACFX2A_017458 [Malus domestica]